VRLVAVAAKVGKDVLLLKAELVGERLLVEVVSDIYCRVLLGQQREESLELLGERFVLEKVFQFVEGHCFLGVWVLVLWLLV